MPEDIDLLYNWITENGFILSNPSDNSAEIQWGDMEEGFVYSFASNANGCVSDTAILQVNIGTNSFRDYNHSDIKIYPNPAIQFINIEGLQNSWMAQIYNTNGQLVLSKKITDTIEEINISELSSGMYIIKLTSENKEWVKQFIKK